MFKTNVYKEAFSHMLTNKMTTEDYSILNLANEAYPAMPSVDSKLDDTLTKYNPFRKIASIFNIEGEGSIVVTTANGIATIVDETGALPESSDESKDIRFSSYKIGSLAKLNYHSSMTDTLMLRITFQPSLLKDSVLLKKTLLSMVLATKNL